MVNRIQAKKLILWLGFFGFFPVSLPAAAEESQVVNEERPVIGWIENLRIYPGEIQLKAKIDTGAKSSSINAPHVHTFERDGEQWVRFDVVDRQKKKKIKIEKKVHRTTAIKRKGDDAHERLVIRMFVCLGQDYKEIDVNLADRRGFNYPFLIGRDDLAKVFKVKVDPSIKFSRPPRCSPPETPMSGPADPAE